MTPLNLSEEASHAVVAQLHKDPPQWEHAAQTLLNANRHLLTKDHDAAHIKAIQKHLMAQLVPLGAQLCVLRHLRTLLPPSGVDASQPIWEQLGNAFFDAQMTND